MSVFRHEGVSQIEWDRQRNEVLAERPVLREEIARLKAKLKDREARLRWLMENLIVSAELIDWDACERAADLRCKKWRAGK